MVLFIHHASAVVTRALYAICSPRMPAPFHELQESAATPISTSDDHLGAVLTVMQLNSGNSSQSFRYGGQGFETRWLQAMRDSLSKEPRAGVSWETAAMAVSYQSDFTESANGAFRFCNSARSQLRLQRNET